MSRIVNLVGPEALSPAQRWALEGASLLKEAVLQQSALDDVDSFCSPQKQFLLLDLVLDIHRQGRELLDIGVPVQQLLGLPILSRARRLKSSYTSQQLDQLKAVRTEIQDAFAGLHTEYGKPGEKPR